MPSSSLNKIPNNILNEYGVDPASYRKLKKATVEFESLLLKELFKSSKGKISEGMFGGGRAEDFFQDFLNDERAKSMVEGGGIGIAQLLEKEILAIEQKRVKKDSPLTDKLHMQIQKQKANRSYHE